MTSCCAASMRPPNRTGKIGGEPVVRSRFVDSGAAGPRIIPRDDTRLDDRKRIPASFTNLQASRNTLGRQSSWQRPNWLSRAQRRCCWLAVRDRKDPQARPERKVLRDREDRQVRKDPSAHKGPPARRARQARWVLRDRLGRQAPSVSKVPSGRKVRRAIVASLDRRDRPEHLDLPGRSTFAWFKTPPRSRATKVKCWCRRCAAAQARPASATAVPPNAREPA
jgi:hypothetical protein